MLGFTAMCAGASERMCERVGVSKLLFHIVDVEVMFQIAALVIIIMVTIVTTNINMLSCHCQSSYIINSTCVRMCGCESVRVCE